MAHSIFDARRAPEFKELFIKDVLRIYAWGVHEALSELSDLAVSTMGLKNAIGLKKADKENAYYHPLPPSQPKQKKWVNEIVRQIQAHKQTT